MNGAKGLLAYIYDKQKSSNNSNFWHLCHRSNSPNGEHKSPLQPLPFHSGVRGISTPNRGGNDQVVG